MRWEKCEGKAHDWYSSRMVNSDDTSAKNPSIPKDSLALVFAGLVILLILQYRTLPKLSALAASYSSFALFRQDFVQTVQIHGEDLLWLALLIICCLLFIVLEWWRKSVTRLLLWTFSSDRRTWTALLVLTAGWIRFYWAPGEGRWVGDATAHLAYLIPTAHTIKSLELPIWTNLIGVGTPYLQYYGFLYFYLAGVLDFFIHDIHVSTKLSLWLGHMGSAATMYLFARQTLGSRPAAFLAALAYVASFWHAQQVLLMGRFPLSLLYALLPLPFYFFERFLCGESRIYTVGLGGIALGALPMVHPGYGFWATAFFLLYATSRLLTEPGCPRQASRLALSMTLLGLVFGAYITLTMFLEGAGTGIEQGVDLSGVRDPSWKRVFLWSNLFFPLFPLDPDEATWYGGYLGNTLLALAVVGAALQSRFSRSRPLNGAPAVLCLLLSFLLIFGYRLSLLQAIPFVTALNAGRYLLFAVFFLSLCVGYGCRALVNLQSRQRWSVLTIPLLLIVADLGPTTLQQPYTLKVGSLVRGDTFLQQVTDDKTNNPILDGQLRPDRLLMNLDRFHPFLASTWLLERTQWPTPQAEHRGILPSMMVFVLPFERYLNRVLHRSDDLAMGSISKSSTIIGGLHMLNVRRLLAIQEGNTGSRVVEWKRTSPLLVSNRLEPRDDLAQVIPSEEFVDWALVRFSDQDPMQTLHDIYPVVQLISDTDVHVGRNSCSRIFVPELESSLDLGTNPEALVRNHLVWDQRVEIDAAVSERCFARLAYAYFPSLSIRVNGAEVEAMKSSGGFLVIPLDPGENRIEIEAELSSLRCVLLGLNLLIALGTAWLWWQDRRTATRSEEERTDG